MDIRFLPMLINQTLMNFSQTNASNSSGNTTSTFTTLLSEALLQAERLKNENSNQLDTANSFNTLNTLTSSVGLNPSLVDILDLHPSSADQNGILSAIVTGMSQETGSSPISGTFLKNGSSMQSANIQATELNSQLKGALENTGEVFLEAGEKYQLSPTLLAAVSIHETGNGHSNAARFKNNVAGMMGKNGLKDYDSVAESIFDMARNLRQNYLDKGLTTILQIGAKYAPIGVANDPTNLNNHWVTGVQRQFESLTKTTDFT